MIFTSKFLCLLSWPNGLRLSLSPPPRFLFLFLSLSLSLSHTHTHSLSIPQAPSLPLPLPLPLPLSFILFFLLFSFLSFFSIYLSIYPPPPTLSIYLSLRYPSLSASSPLLVCQYFSLSLSISMDITGIRVQAASSCSSSIQQECSFCTRNQLTF